MGVRRLAVWSRDVILPRLCNCGDMRGLGDDG